MVSEEKNVSRNGNFCEKAKLSISFMQLASRSAGSNPVVVAEAFGDVVVQIDVVLTTQFQFVFMNTV